MIGRKVFGTSKVAVLKAGTKLGQDVQLMGSIENSKGEKVGKVALLLQLQEDKQQQLVAIPMIRPKVCISGLNQAINGPGSLDTPLMVSART